MKLEWGKKVYCPSCSVPFYSMQKSALTCPNCDNKFNVSDLTNKKAPSVVMDEAEEADERIALSGFEFLEDESTDLVDDSDELADEEVIEDIKMVDEE